MTLTEQDAARLELVRDRMSEWRAKWPDEPEDRSEFLLRLLDAAEARVAEFESGRAYRDSLEERDHLARRVAELEAESAAHLARWDAAHNLAYAAEQERDRLAASLAAAEAALRDAAAQFRWYEQLHTEKGNLDKAATNGACARACEFALPRSGEST